MRHRRRYWDGPGPLDDVPLCEGKRAYSTFNAARAAASRTRDDSGGNAAIVPYLCRRCHRFHVGNRPRIHR